MSLGTYQSQEGQRVLDSFNIETYPGERNRMAELGIDGAKAAIILGTAKFGAGLLSKAEGGLGKGLVGAKGADVDMDVFNALYKKAPAAKAEIDALADKLALEAGGHVAKAPIKSVDIALEKIVSDYKGDPSMIKDLARNTVIVPQENVGQVVAKLQSSGGNVKVIDSTSNVLGYSGINVSIKTNSGLTAEIQVNTPEMNYAKESEAVAKNLLGSDTYNAIAKQIGFPGGQGHLLYERYRVLDSATTEAQNIAAQSRAYYAAIRKAINGN